MTTMTMISDRCQCGAKARISAKTPLCRHCTDQLRTQASIAQENAYLAAYLSSRVDASGFPLESALTVYPQDRRELTRLVAKARRMGIDWTRPPQLRDYTQRLARLSAELQPTTCRNKRGRPAKRKDDESYQQQEVLIA
jgi:hypothetical protein